MDYKTKKTFKTLIRSLSEGTKRRVVAQKAIEIGRGGISEMHILSGLSRTRIKRGIDELISGNYLKSLEKTRHKGGGRKKTEKIDSNYLDCMQEIVARNTGGDPMNEIKWLSTSTRNIANELKKFGHLTSHVTVNRMLHDRGYTLRSNSKNKEGKSHPDRNNQFEIINSLVDAFLSENSPVISVDTKKKEKVGNFKNFGKKSEAKEKPTLVSVYDYPSLSSGSAIPYGTYDVFRNEGFVNIGTSYDTAEFAVQSIDYWWKFLGKKNYKNAKKILICADGGGSNGSRNRAWKKNLQGFSNKSGLEITVAHYPPATSKWNKIEHRLFSFISLNWRGQPLTSYEIIVNLIGATKTKEGLRVDTNLDFFAYKRGIKVSDKELENLNIAYCERFPRWNYTIFPKKNEKK